jgi:disulfide bond formation protein DsbB
VAAVIRVSRRQLNLLGVAACAAMMGFALYAEHFLHLAPCNMCILQRLCVVALGGTFLLAAVHDAGTIGARLWGVAIALVALVGALVAGRHVWMQLQPLGSLPSCGADFAALLEMMSFREAVLKVLNGGGDCQAVTWSLFGLSMPVWVTAAVALLGLKGLVGNFVLARNPPR